MVCVRKVPFLTNGNVRANVPCNTHYDANTNVAGLYTCRDSYNDTKEIVAASGDERLDSYADAADCIANGGEDCYQCIVHCTVNEEAFVPELVGQLWDGHYVRSGSGDLGLCVTRDAPILIHQPRKKPSPSSSPFVSSLSSQALTDQRTDDLRPQLQDPGI